MFIASVSLGLCTFQFKHVRQQSEPSKKQKQKHISLENVAWNLKASMNRCLKWTPVCTWGHRGLLSVYRWMTSQCQNPSEMNRTTDSKISLPRAKTSWWKLPLASVAPVFVGLLILHIKISPNNLDARRCRRCAIMPDRFVKTVKTRARLFQSQSLLWQLLLDSLQYKPIIPAAHN